MIIDNAEGCLHSIVTGVARTKAWRRSLQDKYPDDQRNNRAAETLQKIEAEAIALSAEQWLGLEPFYGWSALDWHEALSLATRSVGFRLHATTFAAFVEYLTSVLKERRVAV